MSDRFAMSDDDVLRVEWNPFRNEELRLAFDRGWKHAASGHGFDAPWEYEHMHRVAYGRGFAASSKSPVMPTGADHDDA